MELKWNYHDYFACFCPGGKTRPCSALESSDYYTQSDSNTSLRSSGLRVGSVTVPNLSTQDVPVAEFANHEQKFAQEFLKIVNRYTKLLKHHSQQDSLNPTVPTSRPGSARTNRSNTPPMITSSRKSPLLIGFNSPSSEDFSGSLTRKALLGSSLSNNNNVDDDNISLCSLSSTLSSRKMVTWGDTGESGVRKQLSDKYMDMLWQHYEQEVTCLFTGPVVGGAVAGGRMNLGNILLCNDVTALIVATTIKQTCLKGMAVFSVCIFWKF